MHGIKLDQITPPFVVQLRDKVRVGHGRWLANYTVTVLRVLLNWGKLRGHIATNPAEGIPAIERDPEQSDANRHWAEAEFAAMVGRALEKKWVGVAKSLALCRWAGMRVHDIVSVKPESWDGTYLTWIPKKSRRKKRVVKVRAIAELRQVLAIDPADVDADALVLSQGDEPYTRDGLQTMVWRLADELEKEGKVKPGLSMHGLRHSLGSDLYDLDLERSSRKAALGHESDAASQVYERGGDRGKLADKAFKRLERARGRKRTAVNENGT